MHVFVLAQSDVGCASGGGAVRKRAMVGVARAFSRADNEGLATGANLMTARQILVERLTDTHSDRCGENKDAGALVLPCKRSTSYLTCCQSQSASKCKLHAEAHNMVPIALGIASQQRLADCLELLRVILERL